MAPIDKSCSNATLQPNLYIEKFNISWLSLCITDVAASVKILYEYMYVLWGLPSEKRVHLNMFYLWKWHQSTDPPQTQLSSVSSTLKSPIFPDLARGLGSAAEQIQIPGCRSQAADPRPQAKSGNIGLFNIQTTAQRFDRSIWRLRLASSP